MSLTGGNDAGFTLLELLIVMALLAMAAVTAVFWVPDLGDRILVARSADLVEQELGRIAREASATGYDRIVSLQTSNGVTNLEYGERSVELDPSISISWTAAAEAGSRVQHAKIAFFATGGASGGNIELVRGNSRAVLEVDWLTGKIRRLEPQQ
jgi:general secretion pathway protein H